jgi:hypothetical protein
VTETRVITDSVGQSLQYGLLILQSVLSRNLTGKRASNNIVMAYLILETHLCSDLLHDLLVHEE